MSSNKGLLLVVALLLASSVAFGAMAQIDGDGCTVIGVGKNATVDGSVITSHTDASSECRLHVVPGKKFPKGAKAPVYWGMVYFGPDDERAGQPFGQYGRILGEIPQVEETYTYFHTGYSQMNAHQLAIGESTCSQKPELHVDVDKGRQIMTVEQVQAFALQRAKTARGAIDVITTLIDEYGFLPSCGGAETLVIADTKEVWSLEIFSVGPDWDPESGEPGALWAARRVPDGHLTVVPNYVRIREIDLEDPDQLASSNYMKVAIDKGWYDPKSGKPFIWQEAYAPPVTEGSLNRLWLIYSTVAPSFKKWPDRSLKGGPSGPGTMASQQMEGADFYPFSVKPEKKLSVQDIIAFQRSVYDGTVYSMAAHPAWLVPDGQGGYDTSPLTTPFPPPELRKLLHIPYHRPIPRHGYGMVAQLRDWLPDPIGGVYWFYVDNPYVSTYVPVYAGTQKISPLYQTYDAREYSEDSARWSVDLVDNLLHMRWQEAIQDLWAVRDPMEDSFFTEQTSIEKEALRLHEQDPAKAEKYLTDLTGTRMEKVVDMYRELQRVLITKYTNNTY